MRAPESPFERYHVRAKFVFHLFNVSLCFRAQSATICHIQFQWKVTEYFRNRTKKNMECSYKNRLIEKIFRKKKFAEIVVLFIC